jgi:hypothetical protein
MAVVPEHFRAELLRDYRSMVIEELALTLRDEQREISDLEVDWLQSKFGALNAVEVGLLLGVSSSAVTLITRKAQDKAALRLKAKGLGLDDFIDEPKAAPEGDWYLIA